MRREERLARLEQQTRAAMVAALLHGMRQQPLSEQGLWLFYALEHQPEQLWSAVCDGLSEQEWDAFCPGPMQRFLESCTLAELEAPVEQLWPRWQYWLRRHPADPA